VNVQLLLFAKAPVAGRVKTRLSPPATAAQAAAIAAAALADTIDVLAETPATRRTIVLCGRYRPPADWHTVAQRGTGLADRLVHAYADTALPGTATLLVGMDTPQLTAALLHDAVQALRDGADAVLGPAHDGGWWTLGLPQPAHACVLREVPMSTPRTGEHTLVALRRYGLRVALLPTLRDVDDVDDAYAVAAQCPDGRFAEAVRTNLPRRLGEAAAGPRSR
jgi:rSAM/selenodomain-associated transferase 1